MSIDINSTEEELENVVLHHLPCHIATDEKANVESFFKPKYVEEDGKKSMAATFRGRPLDGRTLALNEDTIGLVLTEKQKPFSEEEVRNFEVVGKFDSFTQWYLDSQYLSGNSVNVACKTWPGKFVNAVHDPIEPVKSE